MQRRQFFICSALAVVAVGPLAGALAYHSADVSAFLRRQLSRLIGDFELDAEQEKRLLADFVAQYGEQKLALLMGLYKLRENLGVAARYANQKIENFERKLVTHFLTATDYLSRWRNNANPSIQYRGPGLACRNPFARFTL